MQGELGKTQGTQQVISLWNDSKSKKLGAGWTAVERRQTLFFHMLTIVLTSLNREVLALNCNWQLRVVHYDEP